MSSFHPSARAGLALFSAVLCAFASPAQADPGDHLACFKVKTAESFDAATVDLEAVLPGFDLTGCKVSKKATQYCVPVTKTVTSLEGGTAVVVDGDTQVRQRLCYKIRCETFSPQVVDATDQFGTHTMEVGKAVTVCTPAVPGDGPTTTTTLPSCVDADSDTYGTDCPAGADCDDANGAVHPGATELCNGLDDDCDTNLDESDPAAGAACTTGSSGSCAGTLTCSSAMLQCVPSSTPPEVCNNVDDDCDFSVDEGLSRSCYTGPGGTNGVGLCHAGSQTCSAGSWGSSCPGEVIPVAETCGDGLDNDCDGFVDEGC